MRRHFVRMPNARGFTLVELLLSIAIIGLLVGLSAPIYASFQVRNDLDLTTQAIADALRRAQTYARANVGDSPWGLEIQNGSATIFKGTAFVGHDTAYDETTTIPSSMTTSGFTEVLYSKLDTAITTTPAATSTLTLTSNTNETRTITINAKGTVNY